MDRNQLYEDFFVSLSKTSNADVILNFYEFLDVPSNALENDINIKWKVKKRISEHCRKNKYIKDVEYYKQMNVLDRIEACLLQDSKNRQIYDDRIAKIKEENNKSVKGNKNVFNLIRNKIIKKDNIQVQEKNINQHTLKQKWVKIAAITGVVLILVGSGVSVLNNSKSNAPETSVSDYSLEGNETYSDADIKYSFRYKVVYGDTISGIAQKFGVSQSDINRESSKRGSIINEGDTLYIATSDKELAESQEEIYIDQQNNMSK